MELNRLKRPIHMSAIERVQRDLAALKEEEKILHSTIKMMEKKVAENDAKADMKLKEQVGQRKNYRRKLELLKFE